MLVTQDWYCPPPWKNSRDAHVRTNFIPRIISRNLQVQHFGLIREPHIEPHRKALSHLINLMITFGVI